MRALYRTEYHLLGKWEEKVSEQKTVECKWMEFEMWWIKLAREKSCTGFSVVRNMTIIMRLLCPRVFSFPFLAAFFIVCMFVCFFLFSLSIFALIFPVFVYSRSYAFAIRWSQSDFCFFSFFRLLCLLTIVRHSKRCLLVERASERTRFMCMYFAIRFHLRLWKGKVSKQSLFWKLNEG